MYRSASERNFSEDIQLWVHKASSTRPIPTSHGKYFYWAKSRKYISTSSLSHTCSIDKQKQIYRPSYVWNHFVHYSTVTSDVARLHRDYGPNEKYIATVRGKEWERSSPEVFLDELKQGTLVHAKTVLPHETMYRSSICRLNSTLPCSLGFECPAHVQFSDQLHTKNLFQDDDGNFCNCWTNPRVEQVFAPKLAIALEEHKRKVTVVGR